MKKNKTVDLWQAGLSEKIFNRVLDNYIWGSEDLDSEEYAGMNIEQQNIIQIIKRSRNRNNYKLNKK